MPSEVARIAPLTMIVLINQVYVGNGDFDKWSCVRLDADADAVAVAVVGDDDDHDDSGEGDLGDDDDDDHDDDYDDFDGDRDDGADGGARDRATTTGCDDDDYDC